MPHSLKLIFVFHYFIQYKTTFLSTGLTKSSFGFFHKPYRKTRTNLLANAMSSINPFFFLVLSFLSQNVTCIYALILLLSVDQWLMFWLITDCCVFRNPLRIAYMGVCVHACSVAKSCLTLCNPRDCSPPGFSVRGIFFKQKYWSGLPWYFKILPHLPFFIKCSVISQRIERTKK